MFHGIIRVSDEVVIIIDYADGEVEARVVNEKNGQ